MFGIAAATLLLQLALHPGAPDLEQAAEGARSALLRHDAVSLIGQSPRVLVQLPGAAPSGPVPRSQAVALLESYLHDYDEVEATVQSVQLTSSSKGIVKLQRRFRVPGTSDVRSQALLLSYELTDGIWLLSELRISG